MMKRAMDRRVLVFDQHAPEYDRWFEQHEPLYQSEVNALRKFIPRAGHGLEIGAGTGRFSIPFGIRLGVEPSRAMARIARRRVVAVCRAMGERLPFRDNQFDFVLLVTVICFVAGVPALLEETGRVLKSGGQIIIGFIDRNSVLGQVNEARQATDEVYRVARFYSAAEVAGCVQQAGFGAMQFCQTLFGVPSDRDTVEPIREGCGQGAFVVLSAEKN